ncbi:unnamed protein product, partial [Mesorhabditis belari]|uniref:ZP domain-containing protein n=1 Tax=Mesorhabditis belari TaxID=2138241 RepID=A0AAF3EP24_9BILA
MKMRRFFSLDRILLLSIIIQIVLCSDFEYARIIGNPRLKCGENSLLLQIETSVAFQGRIYVVDKPEFPSCSSNFLSNLSPNGTILLNFERCFEETKHKNGSRIFDAFVAVSFHPIVMTTADRIFSVKCIDERNIGSIQEKPNVTCSHIIRQASQWDLFSPQFHLGDSIVHDWSCTFPPKEEGQFLGILTFCNAVSQSGKIIHLIDENGCIIDLELLGDLSYSNYQVKIYGRAKIFRFIAGEKMRFECKLQMCRRGIGGCNQSLLPPKCSFTKEELLKRHELRKARLSSSKDDFRTKLMTETVHFEREVDVMSEWITVHHNEYTNVEKLRERYILTAAVNHSLIEIRMPSTQRPFLMDISFRDVHNKTLWTTSPPNIQSFQVGSQPVKRVPELMKIENFNFESIDEMHPDFNQFQSSDNVPSTQNHPGRLSPVSSTPLLTPLQRAVTVFSTTPTSTTKSITFSNRRTILTKQNEKWDSNGDFELVLEPLRWNDPSSQSPSTPLPFDFIPKVTTTRRPPFKQSSDNDLELMNINTEESPFEEMSSEEMGRAPPPIDNDVQEQFENHREQWRLDDSKGVEGNDTNDPLRSIGAQCANRTVNTSKSKWTSMNDILLAWSFGSLVVWVVLAVVFFYRHSNQKTDWVRRRQVISQACIIHPEHPWTHRDAFVEDKKEAKERN